MNDGSRREDKALVTFNEEIEIKKRKIPTAKYKGAFFIPKRGVSVHKGKTSLVHFYVYPSFYLDGKAIYSVEIIKSETIGIGLIVNMGALFS